MRTNVKKIDLEQFKGMLVNADCELSISEMNRLRGGEDRDDSTISDPDRPIYIKE